MKQQQRNSAQVYACIHLHMKIGAGNQSWIVADNLYPAETTT